MAPKTKDKSTLFAVVPLDSDFRETFVDIAYDARECVSVHNDLDVAVEEAERLLKEGDVSIETVAVFEIKKLFVRDVSEVDL